MDAPAPESLTAEVSAPVPVPPPATPIASAQRIEALDVVRGFALLGIFLMNIEWFSRPFAEFGWGIPRTATGLDWGAHWFVNYLVQGKFWTIFSLLFGMGFAVMLVRAERDGRAGPAFMKLYLRRILALAVFGATHYIFLWDGDILFSYAVAAGALLIVLFGKPKPIILGIAVLIGLGFIPDANAFFGIAGSLAGMGLLAMYLRSEKRVKLRGRSWPLFSFILMAIGLALSIGAAALWLVPNAPEDPRWPLSIFGPVLFIFGWLSWKYYEPASLRSVRMAVSLYVFGGVVALSFGLVQQFSPDPAAFGLAGPGSAASSPVAASAPAPAPAPASAVAMVKPASAASAASGASAEKPKKSRAERAADMRAERAKRMEENKAERLREIKTFKEGGYWGTVDWRARKFLEKAAGDAGFAVVLVGMFLLGVWFVRSGVMENTGKHLPFFRKLAFVALPVGVGLGLLGAMIAVSHTPGVRDDGWGIARGLTMLGNLPACLGYVGMVVLMLHSKGFFSRIRVLAPLGRMALTNYLSQSLICAVWFYGWGLGHYGLSRSGQMLFVAIVYTAQIAFSHWWLARFRYGPMEWLWRGFTYRTVPPLRIGSDAKAPVVQPAA